MILYLAAAGSHVRPQRLGGIPLNQGISFATAGVAIALCSVYGMSFVRLALLAQAKMVPIDFLGYDFFKSQFQLFLFSAAIILSLGILGTAAMRSAVNAQEGAEFLPAEYVIIYGGVFTLLLIVAYVPVKVSLWRSRRNRDRLQNLRVAALRRSAYPVVEFEFGV